MPTPTYTVTCTDIQRLTKEIYEVHFGKPEGFRFKAGQFILFEVPLVDNPADIQTRAYSIASTPHETELLFLIKITPGGRMSRFLEEKLAVGSMLVMKGPFGLFTIPDEHDRDILFIATSTGVAPFRSQVMDLIHKSKKHRMDLVFGVRSEEDVFWHKDLAALSGAHEHFFLHLALSQPSPAWTGHRGRVQTLVPSIVDDFTSKSIYVCGSPNMTKDVKVLCLSQWGATKEQVHIEGYI